VRLTVLGKSPAWQDAGGACSGYLLRDEGITLLMDCGAGVLAKLREQVAYTDVDAIVVSHLHPDHFIDLVPYAYGLLYGAERAAGDTRPVLHAPPGARDAFRRVTGAWGSEHLIETAFDVREYDPGDGVAAGPLALRFAPVPHYVPTYAIEVRAPGGARLSYGADHGPGPEIPIFARDTDLLLIEATLLVPEADEPRGHITAGEAGGLAREAGARRVVVTHFSDQLDAARVERDAAEAFGGPVALARAGDEYEI